MFKINDRVYAEGIADCIGNVLEVSRGSVYIQSIIDDSVYFVPEYRVWHVGTGPVTQVELLEEFA